MRTHDLIVIGAGSGNMVVDDRFADLRVAIVEERKFGGTCVNYGCIPSKMLSYTAERTDKVAGAGAFDIDVRTGGLDWTGLRDRVFGRTDAVATEGERGRRKADFVDVHSGHARFTGERRIEVTTADGAAELSAERIVVAAGSRPMVPPPVAESGLPFETSDTVMRLDRAPRRLLVLGGGYIAAELAHVFASAGTEITIVEKAGRLLGGPQDEALRSSYTEMMRSQYDLRCGTELIGVTGEPGDLVCHLDDGTQVQADTLLVAVGRTSNSDLLEVDRAGIATHNDGRIVVDEYCRTTATGVFALGDVSTAIPLKHVANREAAVVKHNLLNPDDLHQVDHGLVPSAVFTNPQMASVGATEQSCQHDGRDYRVGVARYEDVAYGWAMQDHTGLCKVITDAESGHILGAHILGEQAASMIHIFVVAMNFGIPAGDLARRPYWIHPALSEVVENALLNVGKPTP
ncbi:MAG: mycothione reductase [Actinomycetota bacterium]|nr:mycothione reductase [Actinomycetota bacterium]